MHILFRKLNHKNIRLDEESAGMGETVGVVTRNGKLQLVGWMGFITRDEARKSAGRPVKLKINRVDGVDLNPGEYVQGCYDGKGVYAVLDTVVVVLATKKTR